MGKKDGAGTLTVTGEGQVRVVPDLASLRLGVLTEGKLASEATQQNADRMSALVEGVKALGVAEASIRTVGLNLYPVLTYDESAQKDRIVAFRAENAVLVETTVALAGQVLDAAVAAGANEGSGITFGVADETGPRKRALEAAVKAARAEAEAVMDALGVEPTGAPSVEIEPGGNPAVMRSTARFEKAAATPVLGGELTITARVRIVFAYAS